MVCIHPQRNNRQTSAPYSLTTLSRLSKNASYIKRRNGGNWWSVIVVLDLCPAGRTIVTAAICFAREQYRQKERKLFTLCWASRFIEFLCTICHKKRHYTLLYILYTQFLCEIHLSSLWMLNEFVCLPVWSLLKRYVLLVTVCWVLMVVSRIECWWLKGWTSMRLTRIY